MIHAIRQYATHLVRDTEHLPEWRNGRRGGLKIRCPEGRVGSNPTLGTSIQSEIVSEGKFPASLYTRDVGSWLVERRLAQTSVRLREAREKIRVADEQLDAMADEASHHELRALVSETPDASYEFRQAKAHADAMKRHRDDLVALVRELEQRQDDLLDKMSNSRGREGGK